MAFNLNPALVLGLKSAKNWRGLARHRFRAHINLIRSGLKSSDNVKHNEIFGITNRQQIRDGISQNFEAQSEHFREHGWAYIPDFFSKDIHHAILAAWPLLRYFTVGSDPTKSYDKGPRWSEGNRRDLCKGINPNFYLGFECLLDETFEARVTQFCDDGIRRVNSSLASAWARSGSLLLPHIDDVWQFGRGAVLNFVIFVDGTTPVARSGATAIYATNDFTKPIFVPPNLSNTALVYETGRFIYHGFPMVGRRKFSKRLIAQYSPEHQPKLSELLDSEKNYGEGK